MGIAERIRNRRIELGMTQEELAKRVGFKGKASINKIEIAGRGVPQSRVLDFARALELSPAELLGWDAETEDGGTIALSVEQRDVPILGQVAAGKNLYAEENINGYVRVEPKIWGNLFALKVKGDSMSPRIMDGDTIIVREQPDVESGQIAVVIINGGEGVVKKVVKFPGGISLVSLNSSYNPLIFYNEEIEKLPIRIIGRVIQNRSDF